MQSATPARRYIYLSIGAAIVTIVLKFVGYAITGSVGLFSDAAESLVNLVAAVVALAAITFAMRPPDEDHTYGHTKAEYFSSGVEGGLILLAAGTIAIAAWPRLWHPQAIDDVGIGLIFSVAGAIINGLVAVRLLSAGRRLRSITLEADGRHLITDVWTTVGVVVGIILVALTGWLILDPLIALAVAANIVWTGLRLLRETSKGLLDAALTPADQQIITEILDRYRAKGIDFHALRTRRAGARRFISMHVLVPGDWSIKRGHDLCEEIEAVLIEALPDSTIFTHLEPREDPISWADQGLDRARA